jgi:hypothetical protein
MTKNNIHLDNTNKIKINKKKSIKKQKNRRVSLNRNLKNNGGNLPWWLQWLPIPSNNNNGSWFGNNNSSGWTWGNSNRGWSNSDRRWGNDNRYDYRYDRPYGRDDYDYDNYNRGTTYRISFGSDDDEY